MALITLTSDISEQDYIIGAIKGQLMQINPDFSIVDISHQLSPFNYAQAAYVCRNAVKHFPPFTFHIILVSLFEEKPEHLLLAFYDQQYFLCADNGLLSMIIDGKPEIVVALAMDKTALKSTLYCTKVMGRAINEVVEGSDLRKIGIPDISYKEKNNLHPLLGDNYIEGQIIYIDNFENVIVNITHEEFEQQRKGRSFRIVFKRDEVIDKISETYGDVAEGEKLALFNAAGYLEIAMNKGNAAGLFGLQKFTDQLQSQYVQTRLFYQTVKVFFE